MMVGSKPDSRRRRARRWVQPRDLVFFAFALATYVHEFWVGDGEPTLLGLFAVFFFLGLIPALKADEGGYSIGDVQSILIRMLGGEPPSRKENGTP
jgi:hypothetical protein